MLHRDNDTSDINDIDILLFSPDGNTLISAGSASPIVFWNIKEGKAYLSINPWKQRDVRGKLRSLAISPDGKTLVSGHAAGEILFWDVQSGKHIKTISRRSGEFSSLAFSPDGKYLVAGYNKSLAILYDVVSGNTIIEISADGLRQVAISKDGQYIVTAESTAIYFYDFDSDTPRKKYKTTQFSKEKGESITSFALSSDGKFIVGGTSQGNLYLWDIVTKYLLDSREVSSISKPISVALNWDSSILYAMGEDKGSATVQKKWKINKQAADMLYAKNKIAEDEQRKRDAEALEQERKRQMEAEIAKKKEEKRKEQENAEIQRICSGKPMSATDYIMGNNPHADRGKCIEILMATNKQMTSHNTGLFVMGPQLIYVEFPSTFRGLGFSGVARLVGMHTYRTRSGNSNSVPYFKVVKILNSY